MIMDRRRHQFLIYLRQPELCELFYDFMKIEQLEHLLEFYLTCDELSTLSEHRKQPGRIIQLIYQHDLTLNRCHLPDELIMSIEQQNRSKDDRSSRNVRTVHQMHRRRILAK